MWIKAASGTLYNSDNFSRIHFYKSELTTRGVAGTFDRSPIREEEKLPPKWIVQGDNTNLAELDSEEDAQKWMDDFAHQVGAFPAKEQQMEWD